MSTRVALIPLDCATSSRVSKIKTPYFCCASRSRKREIRSVDSKTLDVEHQRAVRRYVAILLASVCHLRRTGDAPFTANSDTLQTDVPALDHLAGAECELERWAFFVRYELVSQYS